MYNLQLQKSIAIVKYMLVVNYVCIIEPLRKR